MESVHFRLISIHKLSGTKKNERAGAANKRRAGRLQLVNKNRIEDSAKKRLPN